MIRLVRRDLLLLIPLALLVVPWLLAVLLPPLIYSNDDGQSFVIAVVFFLTAPMQLCGGLWLAIALARRGLRRGDWVGWLLLAGVTLLTGTALIAGIMALHAAWTQSNDVALGFGIGFLILASTGLCATWMSTRRRPPAVPIVAQRGVPGR
jgi:hypothetical protein